MLRFFDTEKSITIDQIQKIERLIGLKFPRQYMDHLLMYNGGRCEPNIFSFIEDEESTTSCVDWFLAVYDGEYDNLVKYLHILKIDQKRLPDRIIPIAHDPVGNFICISCATEDEGYIYFWDHEKEGEYGEMSYSNLILVNRSLNEFLSSLSEDEF